MYSFTVNVEIQAAPARVWRALCDPAEVVQWDSGVTEALDAPPDYPQPGHHVRWRYTNGIFRILHDRPLEVVAERALRSLLSIGPFRFDEMYTLEARDGSPGLATGSGCRLTVALGVSLPLPVLGGLYERFALGPQSEQSVKASMRALKRHCESQA